MAGFLQSKKRVAICIVLPVTFIGVCAYLVQNGLLQNLLEVTNDLLEVNELPICFQTLHKLRFPHVPDYKPDLQPLSIQDVGQLHPEVRFGGHYSPLYCQAVSRVAIIVPFRDHPQYLSVLLHSLHSLLVMQGRSYSVFVVHQVDDMPFNHGALSNIGIREAQHLNNYDCFIFHDVHLIPKHFTIPYQCSQLPVHVCTKTENPLACGSPESGFGGVSAISKDAFMAANGFSNGYWGWGAADNDLYCRLQSIGLQIRQRPKEVGEYLIPHLEEDVNLEVSEVTQDCRMEMMNDGMNSTKYTLLAKTAHRLYTRIQVKLHDHPNG